MLFASSFEHNFKFRSFFGRQVSKGREGGPSPVRCLWVRHCHCVTASVGTWCRSDSDVHRVGAVSTRTATESDGRYWRDAVGRYVRHRHGLRTASGDLSRWCWTSTIQATVASRLMWLSHCSTIVCCHAYAWQRNMLFAQNRFFLWITPANLKESV